MKPLLIIWALCMPFLAFSQQDKGFQQSPTGLKYQFFKDEPGRLAVVDDVIKINFKMMTATDSVLRDTWKEEGAKISQAPEPIFLGSPEEAFLMMSAGDSAAFLISADSLFEKAIQQPMPDYIAKGSFLKFIIKMEGLYTMEEFEAEMNKEAAEIVEKEDATIQEYITSNNMKGVKQPSGLYYVQLTPGTGLKAEPGKTVSVHYTGKLLNGFEFDSSRDRGPFDFNLGQGQVIAGWDEGVAMMSVGEKGFFILPSGLAYGARGAGGAIPPYSILIFEIELLDVK